MYVLVLVLGLFILTTCIGVCVYTHVLNYLIIRVYICPVIVCTLVYMKN